MFQNDHFFAQFDLITTCYAQLRTASQNDCTETRCSRHGPAIGFPFRLKGNQPQHCGYSQSFDLTCTKENQTLLQLPTSAKFFVEKIDHKSQSIHISDPGGCLMRQIQNLSLSSSPFQYTINSTMNLTVFSCEAEDITNQLFLSDLPPCLNASGHRLYGVESWYNIRDVNLVSCTKLYEMFSVPTDILMEQTELLLSWSTPNCSICEAQGKRCGLNSNGTKPVIECYKSPKSRKSIAFILSNLFNFSLYFFCNAHFNCCCCCFSFRCNNKTSGFRQLF